MDFLTELDKNFFADGTLFHCLKGLGLAAVFNFFMAEIYKLMNKSKKDNYIMMQSMIFISVILAGGMMVIGNNLAVAFGLVGAVSIIRFRTNVNSFLDMSFIFLSIVIGMACGLGFFYIATIITIFTGLLMLIVHFSNFGKKYFKEIVELELTVSFKHEPMHELDVQKIEEIIRTYSTDDIQLLEYKDKDGAAEIKMKMVWNNIGQIQELDKKLHDKFPDENFNIKAVRI
ncbi:MAG: DUF4956 domain-containing protein [Spirochaetia bacterium]|nr:DUF4956 domain-containing protein [Spirochaetia bacterium]